MCGMYVRLVEASTRANEADIAQIVSDYGSTTFVNGTTYPPSAQGDKGL